jgi:hypothetical protein
MSDLEWLVALEEIKQLKARRDRYVDSHDWEAYESLHAPDHVSHNDGYPPWTSAAEMVKNVKAIMRDTITAHHSYDAEIIFDSPTKARGIWAMLDASVSSDSGENKWGIVFGYYYESYEKRDGRWLFTSRRWQRYIGTGSDKVTFPQRSLIGSAAWREGWPEVPAR